MGYFKRKERHKQFNSKTPLEIVTGELTPKWYEASGVNSTGSSGVRLDKVRVGREQPRLPWIP